MFNASIAGRNWIFASQPNQPCSVPVKSRNSRVISVRQMMPHVSLIFRIIAFVFIEFVIYRLQATS